MSEDARSEVELLAGSAPGPELATWLASLELGSLSAHEVVLVAQAWERQKAYAEARLTETLAELVDRPEYRTCTCPTDTSTDTGIAHAHRAVEPAGDEVSLALRWSPTRARNRVAAARDLVDDLPATLAALEDGRIDADKAHLIADRTRCLAAPELRRHVETAVLPFAARSTRTQLDRALRREVVAADPEAAEQRRRAASQQRRVSRPEPLAPGGEDGMARLDVEGPAEDLAALFTAVDAAARHARSQGDSRTLDQLRFDTLTGLGWTALNTGHLGCCHPDCTDHETHRLATRHGKAAAVHVTVPVTSLIGTGSEPGHLDGFGPVTAEAARRISTEGPWRALLTEPIGGQLLDYGRTTYTPPVSLAAYVVARDVTCRFPTCTHPARTSDIDHKHPFDHGGTTSAGNAWAVHRGHHFGKTHHSYRIHTDAEGVTWWSTPAGHHYPVHPETIAPLITDKPPPTRPESPDPPPF